MSGLLRGGLAEGEERLLKKSPEEAQKLGARGLKPSPSSLGSPGGSLRPEGDGAGRPGCTPGTIRTQSALTLHFMHFSAPTFHSKQFYRTHVDAPTFHFMHYRANLFQFPSLLRRFPRLGLQGRVFTSRASAVIFNSSLVCTFKITLYSPPEPPHSYSVSIVGTDNSALSISKSTAHASYLHPRNLQAQAGFFQTSGRHNLPPMVWTGRQSTLRDVKIGHHRMFEM